MLLWPAIRIIVEASTPDSPSLVNIVWRMAQRVNYKVLWQCYRGSNLLMEMIY
jgi:hypothetical protein